MLKIYPETLKPQACCDLESTRYALSGVQVKKNCDGAWLAATDGRCLIVTHAEVDDVSNIPEDGIVVSAKAWPTKPVKKSVKGDNRPFLEVDTENGEWKNSDDKIGKDGICEGRFPKIVQVIPRFDGNSVVVTMDAGLLAKVAEALCRREGVAGSDKTTLTLLMNLKKAKGEGVGEDEFEPEVCEAIGVIGHGPGVGVVMPCNYGGDAVKIFNGRRRSIIRDYDPSVLDDLDSEDEQAEEVAAADEQPAK